MKSVPPASADRTVNERDERLFRTNRTIHEITRNNANKIGLFRVGSCVFVSVGGSCMNPTSINLDWNAFVT